MGFLDLIKKPTLIQWETAWQELAQATLGIKKSDPRFHPILEALEDCDDAFEQGDWLEFQRAAERVKQIILKEGK